VLRYLVIATILVIGVAVVASNGLGLRPRPLPTPALGRGKEKPISAKGYANVGAEQTDGAFVADASWALSALPDCLIQINESRGPLAFVRSALPEGAQRVAAPVTLRYGNCTILVRANDALVLRGVDRLHIPPSARFYRLGRQLLLLHSDASGAQLRTYVPSNP
jgi:hypothetical protein